MYLANLLILSYAVKKKANLVQVSAFTCSFGTFGHNLSIMFLIVLIRIKTKLINFSSINVLILKL